MTSRNFRAAVAFTAGTFLAAMGGSALAQSSDDMRKQIEDLQRQLQVLKERLDRQEAQPRPSAPAAPAQPSSQPQTAAPAGYSGGGLQLPADISGAWQGWYAGASVGAGSLKSTWNDESGIFFGGDSSRYSGAKAVGSLRGGYNWVQDRLLLGLELDINSGARQTDRNLGAFALPGASSRAKGEINWYSTLRARAGVFASPDTLLYMTGGVAYGKQTSSYSVNAPGLFSLETDPTTARKWGYTVGAGLEYRLSGSMSLTAEYAYLTLRQFNSDISDPVALPPGIVLPFKMTNSLQTGKIGLNWRF